MKTYEQMAQSALKRGADLRKQQKKIRTILFSTLSCIAICCLATLFLLPKTEPDQTQHPTTKPDPPIYMPSNIHFDSIAEIQALFDAAEKGEAELTLFLRENSRYHRINFSTLADVETFRTSLNAAPLPCRDTYENDEHFTLYYYPDYRGELFEFFCNVDGIQYCFLVSPEPAWTPDGEEVSIVTLDGVSAELREGSYGASRRLFANFYMGDTVISMWANTTNPEEVNLSGFYWGQLVLTEGSTE